LSFARLEWLLDVAAVPYNRSTEITDCIRTAMKPPPFEYHDPKTLAEAVSLLGTLDNAKLLAGGQSLMPMLNMRFVLPDHVIDLNRVEGLAGIKENGGVIEIGAMTRQRDLEFSELIKVKCPLLHEAIQFTGHRQTRNRGTIGGSLCHLDPSAEQVTVAAAHDATIVVTGPNGTREIAFADFPAGYLTPAIELNEIVTAIRIPIWPAGHKHSFIEFARRHGDFAIASAAVLLQIDGGKISRASVTVGGVAVAPVRVREVEEAITGEAPSSELFRAACESCRAIEAMADIHASAEYRQHLAAVLSRRALERACGFATPGALH
jgi:carbon-monoxide dehydrogenase medium subunit